MSGSNGVLVRVNGRRVNRAKLLEQNRAAKVAEIERLTKKNALLRAKEAMQMQILKNYEDSLQHMGKLLSGIAVDGGGCGGANAEQELAFTTAAMLDLQAVELMQQLHGSEGHQQLSAPQPSSAGDHPSTLPDSGSSASTPKAGLQLGGRSQRLWASVTPEDVVAMRGISSRALAERFKAIVSRMALLKHCTSVKLTDNLELAADAYGKTAILAMVAADEQFLEFTCLNLDSMQPETPPDSLWSSALAKAGLEPHQLEQMFYMFECYRDQRATLLRQQEHVVQQLQQLLGPGQPHQQQQGLSQGATSATGAAAATGDRGHQSVGPGDMKGEQGVQVAVCNAGTPAPCSGMCSSCLCCPTSGLPPGTLDLELAEQVEQLLQQLLRVVRLQREASRRLVLLWIDLLTTEQHVAAILAAYPYSVKIPAVFACAWQEHDPLSGSSQGALASTATPAGLPSEPLHRQPPSTSGLQGSMSGPVVT